MALTTKVNLDRKVYFGQYDFSADENELTLPWSRDALPATVHGDRGRMNKPGLESWSLTQRGFVAYGADLIDEEVIAAMKAGTTHVALTVAVQNGLAGEIAYFGEVGQFSYSPVLAVGQLPTFDLSTVPTRREIVRGTIMAAKATRSSTANGTAYQLGAVSSAQKLFAALHVFSAAGTSPTLTVTVQSATTEGFSGATTRITFTQKTAAGYEVATPVDGAITDTWWRVVWTLGGTSPQFSFAAVVGIQK